MMHLHLLRLKLLLMLRLPQNHRLRLLKQLLRLLLLRLQTVLQLL